MMNNVESTDTIDKLLDKHKNLSTELKDFIISCMKFSPKDRETPEKLLEFDFIKNNKSTKPSMGRFLYNEYLHKNKNEKEEKN
jgi:hypothetical protein